MTVGTPFSVPLLWDGEFGVFVILLKANSDLKGRNPPRQQRRHINGLQGAQHGKSYRSMTWPHSIFSNHAPPALPSQPHPLRAYPPLRGATHIVIIISLYVLLLLYYNVIVIIIIVIIIINISNNIIIIIIMIIIHF